MQSQPHIHACPRHHGNHLSLPSTSYFKTNGRVTYISSLQRDKATVSKTIPTHSPQKMASTVGGNNQATPVHGSLHACPQIWPNDHAAKTTDPNPTRVGTLPKQKDMNTAVPTSIKKSPVLSPACHATPPSSTDSRYCRAGNAGVGVNSSMGVSAGKTRYTSLQAWEMFPSW